MENLFFSVSTTQFGALKAALSDETTYKNASEGELNKLLSAAGVLMMNPRKPFSALHYTLQDRIRRALLVLKKHKPVEFASIGEEA